MKKTLATVQVVMLCLATIMILPGYGAAGEDEDNLSSFYLNCISMEIEKCRNSSEVFSNSSAENILNYARVEQKKAEFLNKEKDHLVSKMLNMKIEPKLYKVEAFLNRQFFDYLK